MRPWPDDNDEVLYDTYTVEVAHCLDVVAPTNVRKRRWPGGVSGLLDAYRAFRETFAEQSDMHVDLLGWNGNSGKILDKYRPLGSTWL